MQAAILDEKLRFSGKYIEYHVPGSLSEGPPITILVPPPDTATVAILFIPHSPEIPLQLDFLQVTMGLHWRTFGSYIQALVFYSFDCRIGNPFENNNFEISNLPNNRKAYLCYAEEFIQMFCDNYQSNERIRGLTVDAAEDAKEMGCVEGDGFEMLKGLDIGERAMWMGRLKLDEKKASDSHHIHMRAIFEKDLKVPVAFLPYVVDQDGSVWIKQLWLDKKRLDWRHVRRVLFRSVHKRLAGKFLRISCGAGDLESLQFLSSYGYDDLKCNYWIGEYSWEFPISCYTLDDVVQSTLTWYDFHEVNVVALAVLVRFIDDFSFSLPVSRISLLNLNYFRDFREICDVLQKRF